MAIVKVLLVQIDQHGIARLGGDRRHHYLVDVLDGADKAVCKDHLAWDSGGLGIPGGGQIVIVVRHMLVCVINELTVHGQGQGQLRIAEGVRGGVHIAEQALGDLLHRQALVGELIQIGHAYFDHVLIQQQVALLVGHIALHQFLPHLGGVDDQALIGAIQSGQAQEHHRDQQPQGGPVSAVNLFFCRTEYLFHGGNILSHVYT